MISRRHLLSAIGGAAAGCVGCARKTGGRRIKVAVAPRRTTAPLYLAYEKGFFTEAGLDVELVQFTRGNQAIPILAGGELDVTFTALSSSFINAVARGARVRIVASRDYLKPNCGVDTRFYGRREIFPEGLNDMRMLRGKKLAISSLATSTEFRLDHVLAAAGVRLDEVELVELRREEAVAALLGGRVDVAAGAEFDVKLEELTDQLVAGENFGAVLAGFQFTHVYFGRALLDGDRDPGGRFLAGYLRGVRAFLDGETPQYLIDFSVSNGLDPEAMRTACRDAVEPDGDIRAEDLRRFAEWAHDKGYCDALVPEEELVDRRFLERAWARVGRVAGAGAGDSQGGAR